MKTTGRPYSADEDKVILESETMHVAAERLGRPYSGIQARRAILLSGSEVKKVGRPRLQKHFPSPGLPAVTNRPSWFEEDLDRLAKVGR